MNIPAFLLSVFMFVFTFIGKSQKTDSLFKQSNSRDYLDSNNKKEYFTKRGKITAKDYFILLGQDFKQQLTKPAHMKGNDWKGLALFGLTTGTLTLFDEPIQQYSVKLRAHNKWLRNVSTRITQFGGLYEAYVIVGLGAYGFIFKDVKLQTTTLLASQACITSAITSALIKRIAGRQRPIYYEQGFTEGEPTFRGPLFNGGKDQNGKKINSSFPSGHTTAAFSAATVFALEYKSKPWVPVLAYSAATLVGLSRITENKHWLTDVFAGAALGYITGRQVVHNYHRYSNSKANQNKNRLSFNIQHTRGIWIPGLIYQFP